MKVLVGLGNPGEEYFKTRHNIGFTFLLKLIEKKKITTKFDKKYSAEVSSFLFRTYKVWLIRPLTYMNNSGVSLNNFAKFYKIKPDNFLIIHDDLDMDLGKIKLKYGGSSGGHNGLKSIMSYFGNEFWRLKIGIGRPRNFESISNYVLSNFSNDELLRINESIEVCFSNIDDIILGNFDKVMHNLHSKK